MFNFWPFKKKEYTDYIGRNVIVMEGFHAFVSGHVVAESNNTVTVRFSNSETFWDYEKSEVVILPDWWEID